MTEPRSRRKVKSTRTSRRKKKTTLYTVVAVFLVLVIAVLCFFIFKKDKPTEMQTETEVALEKKVEVNGINVDGMVKSEAREALIKKYNWKMRAEITGTDRYGKDESIYEIPCLFEENINKVLDEIYDSDSPKNSYEVSLTVSDAAIEAEIAKMQEKWNVEPKNGSIDSFDPETNSFTYSGEENGLEIHAEGIKALIRNAIDQKIYDAVLPVKAEEVEPDITTEKAKELYKTIGEFETKSTANPDRNNNLNLACQAIDGLILQPGDEFSFNLTTGFRGLEQGYKAAGAYQNGELVEEPGGGVCQVASTLYNALVKAGFEITERHGHTFAPTYVTPGEDSTVSYDGYSGPDLRFTNTTPSAIAIRAHYESQTVRCSIVGIPILNEGETIELYSEKVATYDVPQAQYIEDPTLPVGAERVDTQGDEGSLWKTYIIHKLNGEEISREHYHDTQYKGHTPKITRNSEGLSLDEFGNIRRDEEGRMLNADGTVFEGAPEELQEESPAGPVNAGPSVAESETEPAALIDPREMSETTVSGPGSVKPTESETIAEKPTRAYDLHTLPDDVRVEIPR